MYLKEEKGKFYVFSDDDVKLSKGFDNTIQAIKFKNKNLQKEKK